jgi:hypothetical protein
MPVSMQPPLTNRDMLNVHVRDHATGRLRGAQRSGLAKFNATQLGGKVRGMFQVTKYSDEASGDPYVVVDADIATHQCLPSSNLSPDNVLLPLDKDTDSITLEATLTTTGDGILTIRTAGAEILAGVGGYDTATGEGDVVIEVYRHLAAGRSLSNQPNAPFTVAAGSVTYTVTINTANVGDDTVSVTAGSVTSTVSVAKGLLEFPAYLTSDDPQHVLVKAVRTRLANRVIGGHELTDLPSATIDRTASFIADAETLHAATLAADALRPLNCTPAPNAASGVIHGGGRAGFDTKFTTVSLGTLAADETLRMVADVTVDDYDDYRFGLTIGSEWASAVTIEVFAEGGDASGDVILNVYTGDTLSETASYNTPSLGLSGIASVRVTPTVTGSRIALVDGIGTELAAVDLATMPTGAVRLIAGDGVYYFAEFYETPTGSYLGDPNGTPNMMQRVSYFGATDQLGRAYLATGTGALAQIGSGLMTPMSIATANGKAYIVDGSTTVKVIDCEAGTVATLTASAGSVPQRGTICCTWRGRLLIVSKLDPHNIYASKSGDATDWDTDPATVTATQAWALNAGETEGKIGRPIRALVPCGDDYLIVGTDAGIYVLRGDPANGGDVQTLAQAGVGMFGQNAWCIDPAGTVWFFGAGKLWTMAPGSPPQEAAMSSRLADWLGDRNGISNHVSMAWDGWRNGCWLFFTPVDGVTAGTHAFYDASADAAELHQFPATMQPVASFAYDGDGLKDRYILLGGNDGYIRKLNPTSTNDDGTAISSSVEFTPIRPAGVGEQAILTECVLSTGTTSRLTLGCKAGETADSTTQAWSKTITTSGRQSIIRTRARGEQFIFTVANSTLDTAWALDELAAVFMPGGRSR